jgi:hypothetical protein
MAAGTVAEGVLSGSAAAGVGHAGSEECFAGGLGCALRPASGSCGRGVETVAGCGLSGSGNDEAAGSAAGGVSGAGQAAKPEPGTAAGFKRRRAASPAGAVECWARATTGSETGAVCSSSGVGPAIALPLVAQELLAERYGASGAVTWLRVAG